MRRKVNTKKQGVVTVILKNGVPVRGKILATDKFIILMMIRNKQQLIYKQAISTLAI
ncbi:RNA chaperone Hfq [Bacillus cereus]|uniref:RNA chaperone Hfq n=1 Tax=Bacillus cereus TaxID=1396 RepID=UPI0034E85639